MKLSEVCYYVSERVDCSCLNEENYISTENMTPNCGGVSRASNVPVGKSIAFKKGDILFSNIRPYFKKVWNARFDGGCSADVLCIRATQKVDSTFLYYHLTQDTFISYVMKGSKGCKMPRGDKNYNLAWEYDFPPLPTQHKIASILSSIDSKIETNRKINENLEQQAQALFKSWFIDFEPFKDGEFVESELGLIPKGWKVGQLDDVADIIMGQSPAGSTLNDAGSGNLFFQGRADFGFRFPTNRIYTTAPTRFAEPFSVLLSVRAPVGDMNVARDKCCIGRGLASINSKSNFKSYIIYLIKSLKQKMDIYNSEGTVFGSINKDSLKKLPIVIPPSDVIKRLESCLSALDKEIYSLSEESARLASLRDTLLPKLMSGQIKV